mmetsp:Transcript_4413/g.4988  ORF Transcript_4413/g.4988 Transcript_4413/m.4988 type:complete len:594 (+) Transcript_4413:900-2681(+)
MMIEDFEEVKDLLSNLEESLRMTNTICTNKILNQLKETNVAATALFTALAPRLFDSSTHASALKSLVLLVSTNPQLLPQACTCISNHVTFLSTQTNINTGTNTSTISSAGASASTISSTSEGTVISTELLRTIMQQIHHPSVAIADQANEILLKLSKLRPFIITAAILPNIQSNIKEYQYHTNLDDACTGNSKNTQHKNSKEYSTICIRYMALLTDILAIPITSLGGQTIINYAIENHSLQPLIHMIQSNDSGSGSGNENSRYLGSNDPLAQMSALDMMQTKIIPLSKKNHFIDNWLDSVNINETLIQMVKGKHPFCAGSALQILSSRIRKRTFAITGTAEMNRSATMTPAIFIQLLITFSKQINDEVEKIAYIDSVSSFACQNNMHLEMILKNDDLTESWLSLQLGQHKMKVVVMNSIAMVMDANSQKQKTYHNNNVNTVVDTMDIDHEEEKEEEEMGTVGISDEMSVILYKAIGKVNDVSGDNNTTDIIMDQVKSPLIEVRLGAYELLRATASRGKGAHLMLAYGGFLEFLLSRNVETVKEGKELKYNIVQAVLDSEVKGLLTDEIVSLLEKYIADGPYYVRAVAADVLFE